MEWKKLLSTEKFLQEESHKDDYYFENYPINDFEKDYNKIISSAAFRRLQDKTQVFPLDKSDFIRTRLTHSIEVSTIARQLGLMLLDSQHRYKFKDKLKNDDMEVVKDIPSILSCAGLLHDFGNPPFGHFGEFVIGDWFKDYIENNEYKGESIKKRLSPQMIKDLENYEGNAQTFRILAKARNNAEINLSYAVICALVKYPTDSTSFDNESEDIKKHKPGYFFAEEEAFFEMCEKVGTKNDNGEIYRHPLAFLLEAADDIAYATSDLEDSFKKSMFILPQFIEYFRLCYEPEDAKYDDKKERYNQKPEVFSEFLIFDLEERLNENKRLDKNKRKDETEIFKNWISHVKRWLMYAVVYRFLGSYDGIMNGRYKADLFHNTYHSKTIKILQGAMKEFVFDSSEILKLELASQNIIPFLLDKFVNAFLYYECGKCDECNKCNKCKLSKSDKKYIEIFSSNYKNDYMNFKNEDENFNLYLRLLMVADYVSGMTDTFARTLYRELSGND